MLDKVTKIFYNTIHKDVYGTFKSGQNSIENPNPGDIWPCPIYKSLAEFMRFITRCLYLFCLKYMEWVSIWHSSIGITRTYFYGWSSHIDIAQ